MTKLEEEQKEESHLKINRLKKKVLTIARFNRMFKNAKENAELLARVKMITHDGKLP
jgi:hypothetical protein